VQPGFVSWEVDLGSDAPAKEEQVKKSKASATMNYSVPVRVRRPKLELLPSVAYLDIKRLAAAQSAEVELGTIQGGCCRRQVNAVIVKGKVTGFKVKGCSGAKPPTPELSRLLKAARKHLTGSATPAKFRAMPVGDFFRNAGEITIEVTICIEICVFGRCYLCCVQTGQEPGCASFDDPL
jgi:hypothetical protein